MVQRFYCIDQSVLVQEQTASEASLAAAKTALACANCDVARYRPREEINAVSQREVDRGVAREGVGVDKVGGACSWALTARTKNSVATTRAQPRPFGMIDFSRLVLQCIWILYDRPAVVSGAVMCL